MDIERQQATLVREATTRGAQTGERHHHTLNEPSEGVKDRKKSPLRLTERSARGGWGVLDEVANETFLQHGLEVYPFVYLKQERENT